MTGSGNPWDDAAQPGRSLGGSAATPAPPPVGLARSGRPWAGGWWATTAARATASSAAGVCTRRPRRWGTKTPPPFGTANGVVLPAARPELRCRRSYHHRRGRHSLQQRAARAKATPPSPANYRFCHRHGRGGGRRPPPPSREGDDRLYQLRRAGLAVSQRGDVAAVAAMAAGRGGDRLSRPTRWPW
ncbi:hypothetical protein I4F81_005560 [Pyropia yezoensis]|uniref:Uncharacterized protein n=1 Tax=Pyropia yezoensis TaxID=2788 RepID=A0ACC3BYK6_PYRYE|nr:hypothetical protein I4F81_005560 [Neopyropia yezoensis]